MSQKVHPEDPASYEAIKAPHPSGSQLGKIQARTLPPISGLKSDLTVQALLYGADADSALARTSSCPDPTPPEPHCRTHNLHTQNASRNQSSTVFTTVPSTFAGQTPFSRAQSEIPVTLDTELGPIDIQIESKIASESRKRNRSATHRYRRHRKAEVESFYAREKHYRSERNYFRDLAIRHDISFTTRPPSPTRLDQVD